MKRMLCRLAAVMTVAANTHLAAQPSFISDSLDAYVVREMQRWSIPGVALTVVKDGKVVFMKGFGVREEGQRGRVNGQTLFQIASCTKAFTGTALAMLEVQGRLSLDDKITTHLPEFRLYDDYPTREVTIRDMLSHRIGLRTFQGDFLHWDCNLTRMELLNNMRNIEPVYSFRSRFGYCNAGFVAAGEIIPVVTDTSWDDFLKHNFFLPLNMVRTTTALKYIEGDANAARPYTLLDEKLHRLTYADIGALGPAASINSCAADMANWLLMLLDSGRFNNSQPIPFKAIRMTQSSQTITREPSDPTGRDRHFRTYGLGWYLEDFKGRKVVYHDGGANGFLTNTTLVPQERFGFAIFTNTDANWFYSALQQQLLDAVCGEPYVNRSAEMHERAAPWFRVQDSLRHDLVDQTKDKRPALDIEAYAGKYHNEVYGKIEIIVEKGQLVVHFSRHPRLTGKLLPAGENRFVCVYSDVTYGVKEFPFEVTSNKATALTVTVNDFIDYMAYRFSRTD